MAFYKLQIGRSRKFVEGGSENDWEPITCAKQPDHQRAGCRLTDLFLDVISWNVVDFSRTMLSEVVVTDHALEVLRAADLTGFAVKPTRIATLPSATSHSAFPRLWELVVTGDGGPAHKDSGIVRLRTCDGCGLVQYSAFENGIVVDASTYDGSDFFTVKEYPKYILVSEHAKTVLEKNRLTNVGFVESSTLKWPQGVSRPV